MHVVYEPEDVELVLADANRVFSSGWLGETAFIVE
jgi:hypothetical protein